MLKPSSHKEYRSVEEKIITRDISRRRWYRQCGKYPGIVCRQDHYNSTELPLVVETIREKISPWKCPPCGPGGGEVVATKERIKG
jgi:hypothetical protein